MPYTILEGRQSLSVHYIQIQLYYIPILDCQEPSFLLKLRILFILIIRNSLKNIHLLKR